MDMKVHCPGCSRSLRVPQSSSGRKARCPNCRRVFVVPRPEDLVDETISTWIEEDLEKLGVENEKHWETIGSIKAYQRPGVKPKLSVGMRMPGQAPAAPAPAAKSPEPATTEPTSEVDGPEERSTIVAVDDATAAPADATEASGVQSPAAPAEVTPQVAAAPPPVLDRPAAAPPRPAMPVMPQAPAPPAAATIAPRGGARDAARNYPNSLRIDPNHPHLVVANCDQSGVTFAFDCAHLEHFGFRTSLPIRCAFSGETERRKLFARPFAFIDRSGARVRSPQEIESKHTTTLLSGQSTRDLLDVMGNIEVLPKPYAFCVPYYGSSEFSHVSLKCWTETRGDGGVTCYVIIPDGRTALQWLMNVNGGCGPEYVMLEDDIGLLDNDAWRQLGDECRRRLAVWCPFEPMEQFRTFLSDGDFGTRDKGLAGIVVTDRRLIYCKYHHRGSIDLSEPATLRIRDDADFAHLVIEHAHGKTKLVKLHDYDVPLIIQALAHLPQIAIERVATAAPQPAT